MRESGAMAPLFCWLHGEKSEFWERGGRNTTLQGFGEGRKVRGVARWGDKPNSLKGDFYV